MLHDQSATPRRRARAAAVAAVLVAAAVLGVRAHDSLAASPIAHSADERLPASPPRGRADAVGAADGVDSGELPLLRDHSAAVTRLDPGLLDALRDAAADAAADGVTLHVNSGWRSRAYQEQLFQEAVARYGSEEKAARWVARPGTSVHEAGDAVDVGHADATAWLSRHGAGYGLCQVYGNEAWHFELRPEAVDDGCPSTYADPTHDPRMQR
jgi:zinc D-Ala-D-Ala carboxypeptidase